MKKKELETPETPEVEPPVAEEEETPETPEGEEGEVETKELIGTVKSLVEAEVAKMRAELETPVVKNINVAKSVNVKAASDRMTKEEKFKQFVINVKNQDRMALKAAGNTTTLGEVIPPTEFVAEVFRLEEEYGVARRDADVRKTDKTSITMVLGDDDIEVSMIGEGEVKPSKKLNYKPFVLTFRKGVGILPLTDEVIEDSAISLWADATQRFARAYSRKEDELVFTDPSSGIVHQVGVNEIDVANVNAVNFNDLNLMMYGVPTGSMANGKFYFHRTMLGAFQRIKDNDDKYVLSPGPNGPVTGTLWGRPYELTEVMPSLQEISGGEAFAIFGSLRYTVLGERTVMKIDMSNTAIVGDPDEGEDLNSWTQDLTSMRAVKRFNAKVKFPEAYSILVATNPVS
jgi:HK97 family phage major capsid protein